MYCYGATRAVCIAMWPLGLHVLLWAIRAVCIAMGPLCADCIAGEAFNGRCVAQ